MSILPVHCSKTAFLLGSLGFRRHDSGPSLCGGQLEWLLPLMLGKVPIGFSRRVTGSALSPPRSPTMLAPRTPPSAPPPPTPAPH